MSARVIVTGGAGFVGANLCRRLLAEGHEVRALDDFSEGERDNLRELEPETRFGVITADVRDAKQVRDAFGWASHVVHLAARKIPRHGGALETLEVNGLGSWSVLEAAQATGARVALASTSDVYGRNPEMPFTEDATASVIGGPKVRRWSYAVSKMFEEQLALAMHVERGLAVTLLRYFGGYGPFQHRGWLGGPQSVFFECARAGEPMPVHGDGSQRRTFTYVDDMVDATVAALFSERAVGEVYNVGSAEETTVLELAQRCWRQVRDDEPRVGLQPYASLGGNYEDPQRRVPDTTRARADLGFEARVSLEEGLARTWAWLREHR